MRCRVHATNGEKLGYALSLKTELDVKHMKIDSTKAGGNYFYLSDTRKFRSHHKNDIVGIWYCYYQGSGREYPAYSNVHQIIIKRKLNIRI